MKRFCLSIAFICLNIILTSCSHTTIRSSAGFEASLNQSKRAVILPPIVEVKKFNLGSSERVYGYEGHLEAILVEELAKSLEEKGYKTYILSRREMHNAKITGQMNMMEESYISEIQKIYKSDLLDSKIAHATEMNLENPFAKSPFFMGGDILVYPEYYFWYRSSASNTLAFAARIIGRSTNYNPETDWSEKYVLRVSLIDPVKCNLLWSNFARSYSDAIDSALTSKKSNTQVDTKRIKALSKYLFKELPAR
ncbi:MAG: hypothetical protein SFT91_03275 [Rickettsiaceae bacterium]|nr:hypothetical protein [Rickettsiaceae bacterium]